MVDRLERGAWCWSIASRTCLVWNQSPGILGVSVTDHRNRGPRVGPQVRGAVEFRRRSWRVVGPGWTGLYEGMVLVHSVEVLF